MRLVADSGLWSTGQQAAPHTSLTPCWKSVVPCCRGPSTTRRPPPRSRSPIRPARIGCGASSASTGTARWPRRWTDARPRRPSNSPASTCSRDRSNRCGGSPLGTGCAAGGPPASATASRPSTARSSTPRSPCSPRGAQDFFTDDTFDSDVAGLLRPHAAALSAHLHGGDPRVIELVRTCAELADDVGVAFGEADRVTAAPRRLCAGRRPGSGPDTVPARSPREPIRSTGARFRPASSTRPSTPSGGASRRPTASRKPLCAWNYRAQGWRRGSPCGCGRATLGGCWCARRRRRRGVPGRGRAAAARHRIGCVGS